MTVASSVASGLHAALLLARGRADGVRLLTDDMAEARRSFWASIVCLPAFVCLRLLSWRSGTLPADPAHAFALDLLCYAIGWIGFALLSWRLANAFGLAARWPRCIALWNWCNVVQYLLLVVFSIPGLLGAPPALDQAAQIFALCWALWLEWFAFRLTLAIGVVPAAGLVALDLAIGVVLAAVNQSLLVPT